MFDLDSIRQQYRRFAENECRGYSELYYRLALDAADDDVVMRFVADRPVTQPNLFLAAIQFVTGVDRMPATGSELRTVLGRHEAEIAAIMSRRRTQTNEVGRCAVILPALPPGPLALVEVGASAGLCLLLDRFSYDYGPGHVVGRPASGVSCACALANAVPVPTSLPTVVWRRGLDLAPVDVWDDDAVRWLRACVWTDHPHRRRRLAAAVVVARSGPPVVVAGDLVDDLEALLVEAPASARLVVFHSAALAYVSHERREAFAGVLAKVSTRREVVWVSNEAPGVVPRHAAGMSVTTGRRFIVGRTTFRQGVGNDERLAMAHPHGAEMTWLGTTASTTGC